ncbi:Transmembrane protein 14C [Geodia barretti]|uniref:Transmembrane protein 14C n=1 Tax=Geodia barretti TaxID=519541 RepID=A0AA35TZN8_GEOBA|nr:Transmembrane protein 14C [Geodia barretti]
MAEIDYLSYAFAVVVLGGGIVGFVKAGSVVSLASGVGFGVLLGIGATKTTANRNNFTLLLGTSCLLLAAMGWRYYSTGKFMPAGLVTILSLVMVIRLCLRMV